MAVKQRRDRHDLVAEILDHARGGQIKTHIMYKAKLSYAQINEYLPLLVEKEFLENLTIQRKRRVLTIYRTTAKGVEFLNHLVLSNKLWESH